MNWYLYACNLRHVFQTADFPSEHPPPKHLLPLLPHRLPTTPTHNLLILPYPRRPRHHAHNHLIPSPSPIHLPSPPPLPFLPTSPIPLIISTLIIPPHNNPPPHSLPNRPPNLPHNLPLPTPINNQAPQHPIACSVYSAINRTERRRAAGYIAACAQRGGVGPWSKACEREV